VSFAVAIPITLRASKSFGFVRFVILESLTAIWWTNSSFAGSSMLRRKLRLLVAAGLVPRRTAMAATYGNPRINGGEYRDSLRSANSASVYSTESGSYLDSSPLDSIIRDYPAVPKYPSVPYGSSLMAAESSSSRFQHPQQHPIGVETPSRLREYSPSNNQRQCFINLFYLKRMLICMWLQLRELPIIVLSRTRRHRRCRCCIPASVLRQAASLQSPKTDAGPSRTPASKTISLTSETVAPSPLLLLQTFLLTLIIIIMHILLMASRLETLTEFSQDKAMASHPSLCLLVLQSNLTLAL
jgi:hypothetical protein